MLFLICFFRHFIIPISVDYQYVTKNQQDSKNNIIVKMPDERNRGFWADSDFDLSVYASFNLTYISKIEFEKLWNSVELTK